MNKKSIFMSIMNVAFFDILVKIISVFITIILIRKFNDNEYAIYTKFSSLSSFLAGSIGSGICLSFVRFYVLKKSSGDSSYKYYYFTSIITMLFGFSFCLLCWPLIKNLFKINDFIFIISFVYAIFFSMTQVLQAFYQANNMFTKSNMIILMKTIFTFVYVISLFYIFKKTNIYVIVVGITFFTFISYFICRMSFKSNEKNINVIKKNVIKSLIFDSIWLILYRLILTLFEQLDILMISWYLTDYDLSSYSVALKYYSLLLSLLSSIQIVLRVKTSNKEMAEDIYLQKKFTKEWIKKISLIAIIVVFIGYILCPYIINYLNGGKYIESIPVFRILLFGVGLSYITAPNMGVMMATGKHKLICLFAIVALVFNFVGNFIFIPIYGIFVAAITTVISHFILNGSVTLYILMRKGKKYENINNV